MTFILLGRSVCRSFYNSFTNDSILAILLVMSVSRYFELLKENSDFKIPDMLDSNVRSVRIL